MGETEGRNGPNMAKRGETHQSRAIEITKSARREGGRSWTFQLTEAKEVGARYRIGAEGGETGRVLSSKWPGSTQDAKSEADEGSRSDTGRRGRRKKAG